MELWDLIFREYHDPKFFLDSIVSAGQFVSFLRTFQQKHEERIRWEFYLHKLSVWDSRSWDQFNHDLDFGTAGDDLERPSDDEIVDIVKDSIRILKDFQIEERG